MRFRRSLRIDVIENQVVVVRRDEHLAPELHEPPRTHEASPDRLHVRSRQEPGGSEVGHVVRG
ncbi:hypothetical protein D3C83_198880 [compost metagenome]